MFLSESELYELTGKKRSAAQCRALIEMGVPHWVRPDGKPVVVEADLLQTKAGKTSPSVPEPQLRLG